jgi:RNA polymerase sigma factor (sigma-70 family)
MDTEARAVTARAENDENSPEPLVERARGGDRSALEGLVRAIQDPLYGLALRMLGEPAEAEDATQEILVKVITRLDSFRGESRFTTWVFAVAANHLRTMRARSGERRQPSFEQMIERQARVLPGATAPAVERTVLTREIRLMCLHGLLLCLDREHRLAYVLGEALELSGVEGAQVLGVEPEAFRKRLSRARQRMREFMLDHCGLVRPDNRCRCELWCDPALEAGVVEPEHPRLAGHPAHGEPGEDLRRRLDGLDELQRIGLLFRSMPAYRAPDRLVHELNRMLTVERDRTPRA